MIGTSCSLKVSSASASFPDTSILPYSVSSSVMQEESRHVCGTGASIHGAGATTTPVPGYVQACDMSWYPCAEYEELQQVASNNQRRDDRLAKVRGKNFSAKLEEMEVSRGRGRGGGEVRRLVPWLQCECAQQRMEVEERREKLQVTRRELVSALQASVFPVEVEPLSVDDAGEEGEGSSSPCSL